MIRWTNLVFAPRMVSRLCRAAEMVQADRPDDGRDAQATCRKGLRAMCARVPRLAHELAIARADGTYTYCSTVRINIGRAFTAIQDEGRIQFVFPNASDLTYAGGIDADVSYRAGAELDMSGSSQYLFMRGQIHVGPSGQPVSIDTTQEYSGKTTEAACDVRASFAADYQPAKI